MDTNIKKVINKFNSTNHGYPNSSNNNWFKNFDYLRFNEDGSITCRVREDCLSCLETQSLAVALLWEDCMDMEICGEDGSAGNWDSYTPVFCWKTNMLYLVMYSTAEEFKIGKEVTIYGRGVDEEEMAELQEYMAQV